MSPKYKKINVFLALHFLNFVRRQSRHRANYSCERCFFSTIQHLTTVHSSLSDDRQTYDNRATDVYITAVAPTCSCSACVNLVPKYYVAVRLERRNLAPDL